MAKYEYWHIVTGVDKSFKGKLNVGNCITHYRVMRDEWTQFFLNGDFVKGYKLRYLGRMLKTTSKEEKNKQMDKWLEKEKQRDNKQTDRGGQ